MTYPDGIHPAYPPLTVRTIRVSAAPELGDGAQCIRFDLKSSFDHPMRGKRQPTAIEYCISRGIDWYAHPLALESLHAYVRAILSHPGTKWEPDAFARYSAAADQPRRRVLGAVAKVRDVADAGEETVAVYAWGLTSRTVGALNRPAHELAALVHVLEFGNAPMIFEVPIPQHPPTVAG